MDLGISGRTALVFGAGGGLGTAIAHRLACEGAYVFCADINLAAAEKTTRFIAGEGWSAEAMQWDLADVGCANSRITEIETRRSPVDILVNNTGGPPPTTAGGQSAEVWTEYFRSMVLSVITVTDRVVPIMRQKGWGRIITSTSSGVVSPIPNLGISNALRLSLVGWSKTLSREVGRDGVTANVILPGRIATNRILFLDQQKAKREGREVQLIEQQSIDSIPIGRYGRPEEYGDAVAFLASERASYITGSVIRVDGGLIASI